MRLLFYISGLSGGGAERVMVILCNELVQRGYEIYLATNTKRFFAYKLDEKINILSLYPKNYEKLPKISQTFKLYYSMRFIARKVKPDIIISFIHNVCLAVAGLSIPVIQSEHTTFARKVSCKFDFERLYINKLADKVTVLTQYDYDLIGKRLLKKIVMPNPLTFSPLSSVPDKDKTVLAVGRLNMWKLKGFDTLIKIWSLIANRYCDWNLEIAGAGTEEDLKCLKDLTSKCGVTDSVRFLGFRSDVDKLMQRSSIFILTSKYEGFGMVLLEAMSQGCACVSFDCKAGPREIITHNRDGLLVTDQDEKEMAKAISLLIEDKDLRMRLSTEALQKVKRYKSESIINRWECLFAEILKEKK